MNIGQEKFIQSEWQSR